MDDDVELNENDEFDEYEEDDSDYGFDVTDEPFIIGYVAQKWTEDGGTETRYTELGQALYNVDEYGNPLSSDQ